MQNDILIIFLKNNKNAKKLLVFGKNDSRCLFNFSIFFENLIIFLEPANKLITEMFELQNNSCHDGTTLMMLRFLKSCKK